MRREIATVLFLLLAFAGGIMAGELREIELTDGSIVTGEVVSLINGVYTIRSGSLGTLTLNESKIRSVRQRGSLSSGPAAGPDVNAQAQAIQERMLKDQDIMAMILSLQNDPEFQAILQDPEIMKAVNAGDISALMANPTFMELLRNPTVQEIGGKAGK